MEPQQAALPRKAAPLTGPTLLSHSEVLSLASASPSIIRIRDLQTTLNQPSDAWGRTGKVQPALISVEVRLREPFASSSATDTVDGDTVHYGLLAKEVLALVEKYRHIAVMPLVSWTSALWHHLTGGTRLGGNGLVTTDHKTPAFLQMDKVRYLKVTTRLPKASLLGEGVSVSWAAAFHTKDAFEQGRGRVEGMARTLRIERLRIPTLVGVNANERKARQIVLASLDVEGSGFAPLDVYVELEAVVVEEISESSFETLEALAHSVLAKLKAKHEELKGRIEGLEEWTLGIELEKPIAVPSAQAACVELRVRTG